MYKITDLYASSILAKNTMQVSKQIEDRSASLKVFFLVIFASKKLIQIGILTKRETREYFEIWIDFFESLCDEEKD